MKQSNRCPALNLSRFVFPLCIVFLLVSCRQVYTTDIVIENVTVVDIETGELLTNRDVMINGNKISKIVPHALARYRSGTVIDGRSKYLIPGLWDMHEHLMSSNWYETQLPLLRANGITGFREMFGDLATADTARMRMNNNSLPFFRFIASGHIVDGEKPFWERSVKVADTKRAAQVVDSLKGTKADFIKVYSLLRPDVFLAIAKRSKEQKIPFAGHVPYAVQVTEASNAGMASMEHLYGFLTEACSNSEAAMAVMQKQLYAIEQGNDVERKRMSLLWNTLVLDDFSKERMQNIARTLKRNHTHIVPTLVTLRGKYFSNDSAFTNDPRLRYMSAETLGFWKEMTTNALATNTATEWSNYRKRWQLEKEVMRILIAEKVPIMAGTDADNPYAFPGFSLHDELALYVECGMQPVEALRSATWVPAAFLNMTDSLGSVKEGKFADLVLLEANPLDDISNTSRVFTVIANGKIYGKRYIDSVLKR